MLKSSRERERERERESELYVLGDAVLKNDTKRREQRERFSKRYFKQRERERHENRRRGFVRLVAESFGSMKKISIAIDMIFVNF